MRYRTVGQTGLRVSEIGFGCGNNAVLMVKAPYEEQVKVVRRALEAGINFFDTAFAYGLGESEENLGRILNDLGASPVISTKIRLEADAVGDVRGATIRAIEAGLARLNRERVDFIQLHTRVTEARGMDTRFSLTPKEVLGPRGVLDGFKTMRDRGKVGYFGFSGLGDPAALHKLVESGEFQGFQCYYNLLNPSAARRMPKAWTGHDFTGVIDACRAHGVAVLAIRIFAAGVIATDERTGRESVLTANTSVAEDERKTRAVFEAIGSGHGTRAQVALRFVLSNLNVSAAIIGSAELHHIDEALQAAALGPLPRDVLARLDNLYESDFRRVEAAEG